MKPSTRPAAGNTGEAPVAVRAARVAGTLFVISAFVGVVLIGERLVAPASRAASTFGYFVAPAGSGIVYGALGASLRRGSLRFRRLAVALTIFVAAVDVLLRIRGIVLGRVRPPTITVVQELLFAGAVLPLLSKHPSRVHLRVG